MKVVAPLYLASKYTSKKGDPNKAFSVSDASGNPITDIEPLIGAGGHGGIISSDIQEFFMCIYRIDRIRLKRWATYLF